MYRQSDIEQCLCNGFNDRVSTPEDSRLPDPPKSVATVATQTDPPPAWATSTRDIGNWTAILDFLDIDQAAFLGVG